jgi:hypothetical protein
MPNSSHQMVFIFLWVKIALLYRAKRHSTGQKDTPLQVKISTSNQVENHQLSGVLQGWKNSSTLCSSFVISFHTASSEFSIGCQMTHLLFMKIYTQQHVVAL